jgi:hypothetical protein
MPDLATFQHEFAAALITDGQAAPAFRTQAFAVYRNTATRGAIEALRASYPTVDMLVGEEMFTEVALDFRRESPPSGPVLSDYGADFAAFLARQPWTSELPYLADVARLDWLWLATFLAPDAPVTPQPAGGASRIGLHPATRFAWLQTPAMTIWLAHRQPGGMAELDLDWADEGALFTRPGLSVNAEKIDPAFHHLLAACAAPAAISDVAAAVSAAFPTSNVPELLQRGVASGALIIQ